MEVRLRPLRDEEYPWLAELRSRVEGEDSTPEVLASWDRHFGLGEGSLLERNVAEIDGRPVATSLLRMGAYLPPRGAHVWVATAPGFEGRGLASMMFEALEFRALELRLELYRTMVRADDERSVAIALGHGFTVMRTRVEQQLDLGALGPDPAPLPEGVVVTTLDQAGDSPGLRRALYDLMGEGEEDIPAIDGARPAYPEWESAWMDPDLHPPDAFWVALADGEPVGMTVYEAPLEPGRIADLDYTGVRRSWRGRGLGRALKDVSHRELARRGLARVKTQNDQDNPGVMALNRSLGYRVVRSFHLLRKDLTRTGC